MINIVCNEQNQDEVLKIVEQALKGVDASITQIEVDVTELDVLQFIAHNAKQQRVYTGRIEGRLRELKRELEPLRVLGEATISYLQDDEELHKHLPALYRKQKNSHDQLLESYTDKEIRPKE